MEFRPNFVFTIAGSWDYSALVAQRVARKIQVPLIASFNDWYNYGWFPAHRFYHPLIERRFRRFYLEADLALCTSDGMREALGPHPNCHVLYPLGATRQTMETSFTPFKENGRAFRIAFSGNLGDWYGPMLERLVNEIETQTMGVEVRFYGSNASWSSKFNERALLQRIFRGHLAFDKLREEISRADVLLLPMGFETACAHIERTSFKTKFLDYISYRKPIIVWGPEYCSAVRVAREFDSAEVCTDPEPAGVLRTILNVRSSVERQIALVKNAGKMYKDRFDPDIIHNKFVEKIQETLLKYQGI